MTKDLEKRIAKIDLKAERIPERKDTEFKNAVHWRLTLNDRVTIEYSEGIGHFLNTQHHLYNKLIFEKSLKAFMAGEKVTEPLYDGGGISRQEWRDLFKDRLDLKQGLATPPKTKDVLYSLVMDADAINYEFSDWCANYGYSDDSIKAKATFDACRDSYTKIKSLGFTLKELQTFYENY